MAPSPSLLVAAAVAAVVPGAAAAGAGCRGAACQRHQPQGELLLLQKGLQGVVQASTLLDDDEEPELVVEFKDQEVPPLPDPFWEETAVAPLPDPFLGNSGNSSVESLAQLGSTSRSQADTPSAADLEHFRLLKELRKRGFKCPSKYFPAMPDTETTFQFDCRLWRAARLWSETMGRENFFAHVRGNSNPCVRTAEQGLQACGENIAAGNADPAKALAQFEKSDGHCVNMMNPNYNRFAAGFVATPGSQWTNYWTQALGTDGSPADQSCLQQQQPPQQPERRRQTQPQPKPQPGKCEDKDGNCATSYKQYCGRKNIQETCPLTCGVCKAPQEPEQPERRRTSQPKPRPAKPQPKPRPGKCEDKDGNCATSYKQYCGRKNIQETCPLTCGVCKAPQEPEQPERRRTSQPKPRPAKPQPKPRPGKCEDKDGNCATNYKQYCGNKNIQDTCPLTCGMCKAKQPEGQPRPRTCIDKDTYCATEYKQYCGKGLKNIDEACPKTCGLC